MFTRAIQVAIVLFVGSMTVAWTTHGAWAPGVIVLALSPEGVPAPRPHDVRHAIEVARNGASVRAWVFDPDGPPRGTVLLLHGVRDSKLRLVAAARRHAARGFRAVAVDSRGHGESTGRYLTYGVEESRDLVAVLDDLARRELLIRPLAVVGSSYGAATALLHAAIDARVDGVIALAPFASLRQVVRAYLDWILDAPRRFIPEAAIDRLIDDSARMAGFDPDRACPRCVAPQIRAPVLLIHSRDDERIPFRHSIEIRNALTSPSELVLVDDVSHAQVARGAGVGQAIDRWLDSLR